MTPELDRNGVERLSEDESLALLHTAAVARIGLSMNALPVVLPVNIALGQLDSNGPMEIIVRSVEGTKLLAALSQSIVAVEADAVDPISHAGWSVLVQGRSRVLDDDRQVETARHLPLRPWATEEGDRFIAISIERISGRRIVPWQRPLPDGGRTGSIS